MAYMYRKRLKTFRRHPLRAESLLPKRECHDGHTRLDMTNNVLRTQATTKTVRYVPEVRGESVETRTDPSIAENSAGPLLVGEHQVRNEARTSWHRPRNKLRFFLRRGCVSALEAFLSCMQMGSNCATFTKLSRRGFRDFVAGSDKDTAPVCLPLFTPGTWYELRGELWELQTRTCLIDSSTDCVLRRGRFPAVARPRVPSCSRNRFRKQLHQHQQQPQTSQVQNTATAAT